MLGDILNSDSINQIKLDQTTNNLVLAPETLVDDNIWFQVLNQYNNLVYDQSKNLFKIKSLFLKKKIKKVLLKLQNRKTDDSYDNYGYNKNAYDMEYLLNEFVLCSKGCDWDLTNICNHILSSVLVDTSIEYVYNLEYFERNYTSFDKKLSDSYIKPDKPNNENYNNQNKDFSQNNLNSDNRYQNQLTQRIELMTNFFKSKFESDMMTHFFQGSDKKPFFSGKKNIVPEDLDEAFVKIIYKMCKEELYKEYDYKTQSCNNSTAEIKKKDIKKLRCQLIIQMLYTENFLIRTIMEFQQRYFKEAAFKAHHDCIFENGSAVMDANPLSVYADFKLLRGQFHRKPTRRENRYFRIRKCTRDVNLLELQLDKNDFRFVYDFNSIKVYNLMSDNMVAGDENPHTNIRLSNEQMFVLGHFGLRPLERILGDFREQLSIFRVNYDDSGNSTPEYGYYSGWNYNSNNDTSQINSTNNNLPPTGTNNNLTNSCRVNIPQNHVNNNNYIINTYPQKPLENKNFVSNNSQGYFNNNTISDKFSNSYNIPGTNSYKDNMHSNKNIDEKSRNRSFSVNENPYMQIYQNNINYKEYYRHNSIPNQQQNQQTSSRFERQTQQQSPSPSNVYYTQNNTCTNQQAHFVNNYSNFVNPNLVNNNCIVKNINYSPNFNCVINNVNNINQASTNVNQSFNGQKAPEEYKSCEEKVFYNKDMGSSNIINNGVDSFKNNIKNNDLYGNNNLNIDYSNSFVKDSNIVGLNPNLPNTQPGQNIYISNTPQQNTPNLFNSPYGQVVFEKNYQNNLKYVVDKPIQYNVNNQCLYNSINNNIPQMVPVPTVQVQNNPSNTVQINGQTYLLVNNVPGVMPTNIIPNNQIQVNNQQNYIQKNPMDFEDKKENISYDKKCYKPFESQDLDKKLEKQDESESYDKKSDIERGSSKIIEEKTMSNLDISEFNMPINDGNTLEKQLDGGTQRFVIVKILNF